MKGVDHYLVEKLAQNNEILERENLLLFESNQQNILSMITQPTNLREWNVLMENMITNNISNQDLGSSNLSEAPLEDSEPNFEQINRFQLLKTRRQANRPINGAAEWYLKEPRYKSKATLALKETIIKVLEQIESIEAEMISNSRNGESDSANFMLHDIRNKRFIQSQYKLKLNRLQEQYNKLVK